MGANHNFFNTQWTPGQAEAPAEDDFYEDPEAPDRVCAPSARTRLSAADQQRAGATYVAAAARLFVTGDDRVRPLLDGSQRRAPSAGPERVLSHTVGGRRTPLVVPHASLKVTGARMCVQVDSDENTAGTALPAARVQPAVPTLLTLVRAGRAGAARGRAALVQGGHPGPHRPAPAGSRSPAPRRWPCA